MAEGRIAHKATELAHFGAQSPRRKMEGGIFRELTLLSRVYPSANTKIAEGRPIGDKTGLSPSVAGL